MPHGDSGALGPRGGAGGYRPPAGGRILAGVAFRERGALVSCEAPGQVRRVAMHQREVLLRLARGEFDAFPADVLPYLRDVHDHFVRVGDLADSYRDLVTSALDA